MQASVEDQVLKSRRAMPVNLKPGAAQTMSERPGKLIPRERKRWRLWLGGAAWISRLS